MLNTVLIWLQFIHINNNSNLFVVHINYSIGMVDCRPHSCMLSHSVVLFNLYSPCTGQCDKIIDFLPIQVHLPHYKLLILSVRRYVVTYNIHFGSLNMVQ